MYLHGTYGKMAESISDIAAQGSTVAVYVGVAPVNLLVGSMAYTNCPLVIKNYEDVKRFAGYSADWDSFGLCEAFHLHFNSGAGNIGPIVAINVLDVTKHKAKTDSTASLSFVNGRAYINSDTIILDTLKLSGKTRNKDFTVDYDFDNGRAVIDSIGNAITGTVEATYSTVDVSLVTEADVIGGITNGGEYTGLGCVSLIYQDHGLIPNMILAPGWSGSPAVFKALVAAATNINGMWNAKVYADVPNFDNGKAVDTIDAAIKWVEDNGYDVTDTATPFWPSAYGTNGNIYNTATLWAWRQMLVDAEHDGLPMETASNKDVPATGQYFGDGSANWGFDVQGANRLNAAGITTTCFYGGRWVLWGPQSGAYKHGNSGDPRSNFDSNVRMMMHILNRFHADNAGIIDKPMTSAMADTIKNREQEKVDAWAAMGAFIGTPVVEFVQADNTAENMVNGDFVWRFRGTTTPAFKSGTMSAAYTTQGINAYFEEV